MQTLQRHIFLVDGLGAVASTISPLVVVPLLEPWIGLPLSISWVLAVPAAVFAIYSLTAWSRGAPVAPWLLPIMAGNLGFCLFLPVYLAPHAERLTPLGVAWFVVEILIILSVVGLEAAVWWRARQA